MAKRDPELEHLTGVALFGGCSREELALVRKLMTEQRFRAATKIVTEGEPGGRFYLITAGSATVSRRGTQVRDLCPGDYFGEMALLDEGPRAATVTANTDVTTLALAPFNFRPLLKNNARLTYNILVVVSNRLRSLEATLFP